MPVAQTPRAPVLLVEDDRHQVAVLSRWLEGSGRFDIRVASDGNLAWDLIAAQPWALIVSDIGLPGMDGIALLSRLRVRDDATPFLLISAKDTLEDTHAAIRLRASEFLLKPLNQERFISIATDLVGVSREVTERQNRSHASATIGQSMRLIAQGNELVHQLANTLTPLIGWADLLVAESSMISPRVKDLERFRTKMTSAIGGTLGVLTALRGLVSQGTGRTDLCDIALLTHAAAMLAGPVLGAKNIPLTVQAPSVPAKLLSNRVGIRSLISGLLLSVAEDSSRVDLTSAAITVSASSLGISVRLYLCRRPRPWATRDPLDDLLSAANYQALSLGATVDVTHETDGASVVHVMFPGATASGPVVPNAGV